MSRQTAARQLRAATPEIIEAYRSALTRIGSQLVSREDIWRQCSYQAQNIVAECAQALDVGDHAEPPGVGEYSRLLGAQRAVQQVPVSESVRAAEVLWQAMKGAIAEAADQVEAEERLAAVQTMTTAFRVATGNRLYQGIRGYEEAQRPAKPEVRERDSEAPADAANTPADAQALDLLTLREREILEAVRAGLTNRLIGRRFEISEATVKRHLHNAYRKLGASSRVQALNKAFPEKG
ncbi:LuxR C-terminal-related transcriptional regulator [Streptomyces sp. RerS4]|uniref:helix-turn-helix transcriptional regulator n=1 Tax=Streptomyces sp. RerS4 TaxID=2942449 RepID=UPI00201C5138|nr:LuxR C-terminal-related transcriptional regulator [Streptomyces sp. RerS4]UQX01225.1 LuxR C-terminal-related transcriptional regulator [Streptomyces sp. RerS4]